VTSTGLQASRRRCEPKNHDLEIENAELTVVDEITPPQPLRLAE
jgi:hypothetical protein